MNTHRSKQIYEIRPRGDEWDVDLRERGTRKGRRLEYFTLGWNLTEAVVGIGAGVIAEGIALVGFGVGSIIESFSGAILPWRLQRHKADEKREQLALKRRRKFFCAGGLCRG
jgi:hypothetical protein